MSESFEWHIFLESVEDLCQEVEHRIQLSDSNPLQELYSYSWENVNSTDAKG